MADSILERIEDTLQHVTYKLRLAFQGFTRR